MKMKWLIIPFFNMGEKVAFQMASIRLKKQII